MSEIIENIEQTEEVMETVRVNPFCVVSKATFGEYSVRDIQTNSAWSSNPYGEDYAIVPDEMVEGIMETCGFCDIELNEDGTEIVGFTALEKPEIPEPVPDPETPETPTGDDSIWEELDKAYQEGVDSV